MASKSGRVAGILVLMLVVPCAILITVALAGNYAFRTPVGLHSFGTVDVESWDKGLVSAEGTWQPERKAERILFLTLDRPLNISNMVCRQSWSRKSEQSDKWSFCLTAGTLCPTNQERP
jgi:hypothetical protein